MQLRFALGLVMTIAAVLNVGLSRRPRALGEHVEVSDIGEVLLRSVRPTPSPAGTAPTPDLSGGTA